MRSSTSCLPFITFIQLVALSENYIFDQVKPPPGQPIIELAPPRRVTNQTSWASFIRETSETLEIDGTGGNSETVEISETDGNRETSGTSETNGTSGTLETSGKRETSMTIKTIRALKTSEALETRATSGSIRGITLTREKRRAKINSKRRGFSRRKGTSRTRGTSQTTRRKGTSVRKGTSRTRGTSLTTRRKGTSVRKGTSRTRGTSLTIRRKGTSVRKGTSRTRGTSLTTRRKGTSVRKATSRTSGTSWTVRRKVTNVRKGTSRTRGTSRTTRIKVTNVRKATSRTRWLTKHSKTNGARLLNKPGKIYVVTSPSRTGRINRPKWHQVKSGPPYPPPTPQLYGPPSTHYPTIRPHLPIPHPPITPQVQPRHSWEGVIMEAINEVNEEDGEMKRRLDSGLDKYANDFTDLDPLLFSESPENADAFSRQSRVINWISRILKQRHPSYTLSDVLRRAAARQHGVVCPFRPPRDCSKQRYRTVDGSCNNLGNPLWGATFTPFVRTLPAVYEERDGRDDYPRSHSVTGEPLPNPRVVSTRFHEGAPIGDDSVYSMLITIYGQFLAHDITDRAPTKGSDQAVLKCCQQSIPTPHGKCANFPIPEQDFFRTFNRDCMEFPRSLEVTDLQCSDGSREQLNQASSFIDGGAVYGATKNKSDNLRQFKGGLLMMSVPQQLPIIPHGNTQATMQGYAFYATGDNRVNEFIGLIAMETVWVREHNQIAKDLARRHRDWDDERLFQETRRIIIAMIQHITFAEYLPAILGPDLIQKYELGHLNDGHYTGYDATHNPSLANSFATVAMRFGHSMLRTTYRLLNLQNKDNGNTPIDLKDTFFRPQTFLLHEDPLMRGMATHPSKKCDRVLSSSVINNLYETDEGTGSDLAANNVQRERDHGLPSYEEWRRYFGLSVPSKFDTSPQGFNSHTPDTVKGLSELYKDARDVDLFTAGVSEVPVHQGAVGPTFGNILAKQFKALKKGDRYWYETSEQPQAFTLAQLREIKKVTIAHLLCKTYNFERIQKRAFFNPDENTNNLVPCSSIPSLNLNVF